MSLEKLFHLKENHTDVKTEVLAGITTFMTMAYILAVNPGILGATGMDSGAVFTATAVSALFATLCMAFMANYPFVLAPGMGLNAYFAYTVVLQMGYSWEMALTAVFAEGIIFILLSLTNVREKIFNAIPMTLKHSVSAGIGLFIAFIGLQNAKIVVDGATLVGLYSFKASVQNGTFSTEGITVLLALIGILITAVLLVKQVKGGILWGILATWILGIICQLAGIYQVNPEAGAYSLLPDFSNGIAIPSMAPTLMKMDFSSMFSLDFFAVVFAFLFVVLFDSLGTLIGVASKADMLDKDGKLPRIRGALLSDAVGTTVGAMFGTSTVTTFVESASGVAEGGRTGLAAVSTAVFFFIAMFLSPVAQLIPGAATAAALIYVGVLMMKCVVDINWLDPAVSVPAFLTLAMMPMTYNISYGIAFGLIGYVIISAFTGKIKEIKVGTWVVAILFAVMFLLTH